MHLLKELIRDRRNSYALFAAANGDDIDCEGAGHLDPKMTYQEAVLLLSGIEQHRLHLMTEYARRFSKPESTIQVDMRLALEQTKGDAELTVTPPKDRKGAVAACLKTAVDSALPGYVSWAFFVSTNGKDIKNLAEGARPRNEPEAVHLLAALAELDEYLRIEMAKALNLPMTDLQSKVDQALKARKDQKPRGS